MSGDQIAIWVASCSICAHVTLAIESMHSADEEMKEEKRKETGEKSIPVLSKSANHQQLLET